MPPAELDAVKTRVYHKSYETEIHEMGVPTPRGSRATGGNSVVGRDRKMAQEVEWEKYPIQKYTSRESKDGFV